MSEKYAEIDGITFGNEWLGVQTATDGKRAIVWLYGSGKSVVYDIDAGAESSLNADDAAKWAKECVEDDSLDKNFTSFFDRCPESFAECSCFEDAKSVADKINETFLPICGVDLARILAPGRHPGGNRFWVII